MKLALVVALALFALPALAEDVDRDVAALRTDFEYGKYDEVLRRAQSRLDQGVETQAQLMEIHKLAAVSAFNLGKMGDAERHLAAVLRLDPDFTLDPFVYPPPVIEFLSQLRNKMADELVRVREAKELEQARRRAAEAEAQRLRSEEERRRLEALPRRTTIHTIERRSYFVNYVPFGAGQFQQGRTQIGTLLAGTEGALAATSVIAYWAHEGLLKTKTYVFPDVLMPGGGTYSITVTAIPPEREEEARNWRLIKTISALSFYGVYLYGVIDALIRHQDTIVTTTTVEEPPDRAPGDTSGTAPGAPTTLSPSSGPTSPAPKMNLAPFLFPTPAGGLGAGIQLTF